MSMDGEARAPAGRLDLGRLVGVIVNVIEDARFFGEGPFTYSTRFCRVINTLALCCGADVAGTWQKRA